MHSAADAVTRKSTRHFAAWRTPRGEVLGRPLVSSLRDGCGRAIRRLWHLLQRSHLLQRRGTLSATVLFSTTRRSSPSCAYLAGPLRPLGQIQANALRSLLGSPGTRVHSEQRIPPPSPDGQPMYSTPVCVTLFSLCVLGPGRDASTRVETCSLSNHPVEAFEF